MVTVEVYREPGGSLRGFVAQGHADFGEHGKDIVCAGVAAVTLTAALGITEHLQLPAEVEQRTGFLRCVLPPEAGAPPPEMEAVLASMLLGLRRIEEGYGEHLRVTEAPVPRRWVR